MHVYRWDLDKTYLDTDIESVRGLVRTALETASEKRNVPGSAALMRALSRFDPAAQVHIVSGSPTQMRSVLEEKLALDGVRFESLTLKDNLGNIRKRRFRAVRGQLGYKLPTLLEQRRGLGSTVRETLFGDDSEVDALIYTLYADLLAGKVGEQALSRVLEADQVHRDTRKTTLAAARRVGRSDCVEDIFIHVDHGPPLHAYRALGRLVTPVFSWLQAALVLWRRERLAIEDVVTVARACTEEGALDGRAVAGLLQDAVRRSLVSRSEVLRLLEQPAMLQVETLGAQALGWMPSTPELAVASSVPDYVGFLRAVGR